jgi:FAD linked oxidases, C-terminal domain
VPVLHRLRGRQGACRQTEKIVKNIVGNHGGILVGKGPGVLYDQKKFDYPYIRDFLLDRGAIADVSDTAAPWSKLMPLYTNVMAAAEKAFAQVGVTGYIMCHLSHSYYSGACLYFTFGFKHDGVDPLGHTSESRTPSSRRSSTRPAHCRTTTRLVPSMPPGSSKTSLRPAFT